MAFARFGPEVSSACLDNVLGSSLRSSWEEVNISVSARYARLQHYRTSIPCWRQRSLCSVRVTWIVEASSRGSMEGARRRHTLASAGHENSVGGCPENDELAVDNDNSTAFFSAELQQAVEAMRERSRIRTSSETCFPQTDEKTPEGEEGGFRDDPSDTADEAEDEALDALRKEYRDVKTKLPLETNGPPMAILQPYLAPDPPDDVQEEGTQKLRRLPLIVPHKMRPLELPAPHQRSRVRSIISKRQGVVGRGNDLDLTCLPAEIQGLPFSAPVSEVLEKFVGRLKKGRLARPVRELGRKQLTGRVIEIVYWLQNFPHLWPDLTTLCTAIQVLVEEGEVDCAITLWKEVGLDLEGAAEALVSSLMKMGKMIEAANVTNEM